MTRLHQGRGAIGSSPPRERGRILIQIIFGRMASGAE
jgi:hypothetical protein